ncbi:hypothetical protein MNEG_14289, partial [Monoraphidium neglectum]
TLGPAPLPRTPLAAATGDPTTLHSRTALWGLALRAPRRRDPPQGWAGLHEGHAKNLILFSSGQRP